MKASSTQHIFWQILNNVPSGKVATYGQIARLAGLPNHARHVGTVLKRLPKDTRLPWHRIINSKGEIAFPIGSVGFNKQVALLEKEGVRLMHQGKGKTTNRVNLKEFQWQS